ncbi:MAG TPA: hypothetical protein VK941_07475 [Gillisia sp.]|nr:hypothetical protein [Gillisia sp.]
MLRILSLFVVLTATATATAQNINSTYYIDVLIDASENIYFEDTKVGIEAVAPMTRSKVDKLKFVEGKGITYRIFADGSLPLGVIMDVNRRMQLGFSQPGLSTRRYLLKTSEVPADKSNWIEQLNKLDLKAIED